jgi:hypothetical protein
MDHGSSIDQLAERLSAVNKLGKQSRRSKERQERILDENLVQSCRARWPASHDNSTSGPKAQHDNATQLGSATTIEHEQANDRKRDLLTQSNANWPTVFIRDR